jgi:hypothetical protein
MGKQEDIKCYLEKEGVKILSMTPYIQIASYQKFAELADAFKATVTHKDLGDPDCHFNMRSTFRVRSKEFPADFDVICIHGEGDLRD